MYESLLNYPGGPFDPFDRLRREIDDMFDVSGLPSSDRRPHHAATRPEEKHHE